MLVLFEGNRLLYQIFPAKNYLFKVNNRNSRIHTRQLGCSCIFIVNFEHYFTSIVCIVNFEQVIVCWVLSQIVLKILSTKMACSNFNKELTQHCL